jgi:hypothetical protein
MPRNRVIYQSEGLYVSNVASSGSAESHEQLNRIQSANYSFTINRQDVNQFGDLARIDSLVLEPPTVSLDFSYYLTDGFNERALGFFVEHSGVKANSQRFANADTNTSGNFASGHLVSSSGSNFFIVTSPDGQDLNKDPGVALDGNDTVIGVGNCYISDYGIELAVGSLPTVNVTVEGANMNSAPYYAGGFASPAVDQADGSKYVTTTITLPDPTENGGIASKNGPITALRPGDVTLDLSNVDGESLVKLDGTDGAHIQSASISLPLSRTPIDRLGSRFPFAREVDFPVTATMSISAIVATAQSANLADLLNSGVQKATILVKDHSTPSTDAIEFTMKGLKIDSQSFSSSIGSNKTVDLTFSTQIGGPNDTANGVFMSGAGFSPVFE